MSTLKLSQSLAFIVRALCCGVLLSLSYGQTASYAQSNKPDQLGVWATKAAQETIDFDYSNYQDKLNSAHQYFTSSGWENFMSALKDANTLDAVRDLKLHTQIKVLGVPDIHEAAAKDNLHHWQVKMPITWLFTSDSGKAPHPINAALLLDIVQDPTQASQDGLGITQWVMMPSQ